MSYSPGAALAARAMGALLLLASAWTASLAAVAGGNEGEAF
ncbi:hypothetical protein [Acidovorax sp.]|nr:hypothetical protein [Acidovorax sp.]MDZ7866763.1 hypothetical protein [Acidovorax sp.]